MSRDFWFGMFAVPAAAVAIAILAGVVLAFVWYSERFDLKDWVLWPKRDRRSKQMMAATVACAKWVRYLWVPGWHIVICRTRFAWRRSYQEFMLHHEIEHEVALRLAEFSNAEREQ